LAEKLIPGNDVVVTGPWSLADKSSNKSEEEIMLNFDSIEVFENPGQMSDNSNFPNEVLMENDCHCNGNSAQKIAAT
jgi:hypothetical protein